MQAQTFPMQVNERYGTSMLDLAFERVGYSHPLINRIRYG